MPKPPPEEDQPPIVPVPDPMAGSGGPAIPPGGYTTCYGAPPVKYPDALRWTPHRCASMLMTKLVIGSTGGPISGRFDGEVLPLGLRAGHAYPVSLHLVRAMSDENPKDYDPDAIPHQRHRTPHPEACKYHLGRRFIFHGNHGIAARTITCSEPVEGGSWWRRATMALTMLVSNRTRWDRDVRDLIRNGHTYALSAYETPRTKEALIRSGARICGTPS